MAIKDKLNDEKSLVGKRVTITCIDRAESEWSDVELNAISPVGATISFESRGVFSVVHLPTHVIASISARYSNSGTQLPDPTKAP